MVTSQPGNIRMVRSPPNPRAYSARFDPWPVHAIAFNGFYLDAFSPTAHIFIFEFTLADGHFYGYYSRTFSTADEAANQYPPVGTWVSPFGRVGDFGMWFNFVVRPTLQHKFLVA